MPLDTKYDIAEIVNLPNRGRLTKARKALVDIDTDLSQFLSLINVKARYVVHALLTSIFFLYFFYLFSLKQYKKNSSFS